MGTNPGHFKHVQYILFNKRIGIPVLDLEINKTIVFCYASNMHEQYSTVSKENVSAWEQNMQSWLSLIGGNRNAS